MSRLFNGSNHLTVEAAVVTAAPFTMHCWYNMDGTQTWNTLMAVQRSTTTGTWWRLRARNGNPLRFLAAEDFGEAGPSTSTNCSINVWQSACAVESANNSRAVFLNGGSKATNTDTRTPANVNRTTVGLLRSSFAGEGIGGLVGHPAIWNVALTDAEVAMLAAGISPLRVRPEALVMYLPYLGRNGPEIDISGGRTLAVTGATASSNEPPFIWPQPAQ